jgi:transcriptional regulator with XRE-family HTH domain
MAAPNKALREWLKTATPDQARQLASASKTSVPHLRHIARGRRKASADLAQRLAHASHQFNIILKLDQRELCAACGQCPLAASAATYNRGRP